MHLNEAFNRMNALYSSSSLGQTYQTFLENWDQTTYQCLVETDNRVPQKERNVEKIYSCRCDPKVETNDKEKLLI
jgi:hypothetical protein